MLGGHATFVHSQSEKTTTPAGDLLDAERLFLLFRKKVSQLRTALGLNDTIAAGTGLYGRLTVIVHRDGGEVGLRRRLFSP